ncbi:hypothetical protein Tco_0463519 [Tanacetum coccineum]
MKTNQTHPWWWRGRGGVGEGEVVTWGQRGGGGSGGEWVVVMERVRGGAWFGGSGRSGDGEAFGGGGRKTRRKSFSAVVPGKLGEKREVSACFIFYEMK